MAPDGSFNDTLSDDESRPSIASNRLGPLTHHKKPEAGAPFNLIFVGAGNINFGSDEGPWDHSFRLENKLGPRLKVVAIIDPNEQVAQQRLDVKRSSFVEAAYRNTRICHSLEDFVTTMKDHERPHAFVVGSPAAFRGSTKQGRDFEMQVLKFFPKDTPAMFIEKPLSADTVPEALTVAKALVDSKAVVSVGYFLRYLRVVQTMRQIIEDNDLEVMAVNARYTCSYANIAKKAWWMKSKDCGPIVEQGTHFLDMYFGGDVDMDSVVAQALEWDEPAGQLSAVPVDEASIPEDDRIPRVTTASWKGYKYSCELDVLCDGYQLKLIDPYNAPELRVRTPNGDDEQVYRFDRDDPYASELGAWLDECDHGKAADDSAVADDDESYGILSSYEDAAKSYALSWAIRFASEANTQRFRKKEKKILSLDALKERK
ncbi:hypothetical protein B0A53_04204 [Rhodotorula sp. CCFEE 5036]|nr:hypothetical protein B0A53_04204 [Rhodotorula sp. CCFEE 5036]